MKVNFQNLTKKTKQKNNKSLKSISFNPFPEIFLVAVVFLKNLSLSFSLKFSVQYSNLSDLYFQCNDLQIFLLVVHRY